MSDVEGHLRRTKQKIPPWIRFKTTLNAALIMKGEERLQGNDSKRDQNLFPYPSVVQPYELKYIKI